MLDRNEQAAPKPRPLVFNTFSLSDVQTTSVVNALMGLRQEMRHATTGEPSAKRRRLRNPTTVTAPVTSVPFVVPPVASTLAAPLALSVPMSLSRVVASVSTPAITAAVPQIGTTESGSSDESGSNSPSRRFCCPICAQCFSVAFTLKRHMKKHDANSKKFVCKTCNTAFRERSTLARHIRTHTQERPFECRVVKEDGSICGQRFAELTTTKRHLLVHSHIKPYRCPFFDECKKEFSRGSTLKKHMQKAHSLPPKHGLVVACTVKRTSHLNTQFSEHQKKLQERLADALSATHELERFIARLPTQQTVETPASETSTLETPQPASETPAAEALASDAPAGTTLASETPVAETPAAESSCDRTTEQDESPKQIREQGAAPPAAIATSAT
ncbi:MAG: hypothetical protein MHM6MM_003508 [Cercozoa sp. M6MM]